MNPSLAHALFTKGIDTYDIAKRSGRKEAEVVDALHRYRLERQIEKDWPNDAHPSDHQAMEIRPQA